jgi:thioredoxin 1
MLPIFEDLAAQLGGRARVVKVDVDQAPAAAAQFGITSIPTVVVIQEGTVRLRFAGVVPKQRFLQVLHTLLS